MITEILKPANFYAEQAKNYEIVRKEKFIEEHKDSFEHINKMIDELSSKGYNILNNYILVCTYEEAEMYVAIFKELGYEYSLVAKSEETEIIPYTLTLCW